MVEAGDGQNSPDLFESQAAKLEPRIRRANVAAMVLPIAVALSPLTEDGLRRWTAFSNVAAMCYAWAWHLKNDDGWRCCDKRKPWRAPSAEDVVRRTLDAPQRFVLLLREFEIEDAEVTDNPEPGLWADLDLRTDLDRTLLATLSPRHPLIALSDPRQTTLLPGKLQVSPFAIGLDSSGPRPDRSCRCRNPRPEARHAGHCHGAAAATKRVSRIEDPRDSRRSGLETAAKRPCGVSPRPPPRFRVPFTAAASAGGDESGSSAATHLVPRAWGHARPSREGPLAADDGGRSNGDDCRCCRRHRVDVGARHQPALLATDFCRRRHASLDALDWAAVVLARLRRFEPGNSGRERHRDTRR